MVNRVSFSLEPEYQELLTKIAKRMRATKTAVMRQMIDERAVAIGLQPIAPITAPPSAPTSTADAMREARRAKLLEQAKASQDTTP